MCGICQHFATNGEKAPNIIEFLVKFWLNKRLPLLAKIGKQVQKFPGKLIGLPEICGKFAAKPQTIHFGKGAVYKISMHFKHPLSRCFSVCYTPNHDLPSYSPVHIKNFTVTCISIWTRTRMLRYRLMEYANNQLL